MLQKDKIRIALIIGLASTLVALPSPFLAQSGPIERILEPGKRLGEKLLGLLSGENLDRSELKEIESQLAELEEDLQRQLRQGSKDEARVSRELDAIRSELAMTRSLLRQVPSRSVLEEYQRKLAGDLEKLTTSIDVQASVNEEQWRRIQQLERDVERLSIKLRQGKDSLSESGPHHGDGRGVSQHHQGVTLEVSIEGNSNRLRVSEVRDPDSADLGFFEIVESGQMMSFYLVAGTGAVILIGGANNTVELSRQLCGRVRVVDRAGSNSRVGCR